MCVPVTYKGEAVSSTRIRECIQNGEIEDANAMLGYEFAVSGEIKSGNHIGTKISSPTINQPLNPEVITPKFGVYATKVTIDCKTYIGATNIGVHPTVGECSPVCETHLLDFSGGNLYSLDATTRLIHFIRPEQNFSSLSDLKDQIEKDKLQILSYLQK